MSTVDTTIQPAVSVPKYSSSREVLDKIWLVFLQILLTVLLISFLIPALWMVSSSLKASTEVFAHPIVWIPKDPQWRNYLRVFDVLPFARFTWNTTLVVIFAVSGTLFSSALVGYSFARLRWPGRNFFFGILIATVMLPEVITLVPRFIIFRELGWIDTLLPLTAPFWFGVTPWTPLDMWNIDGVTTNPRHVQASGKPFLSVIQEISRLFEGTDKPISVEVNPHYDSWEDMVTEAERLAALSSNFVIKLPATEAGFKGIPVLAEKGIRVNLTLVFSAVQALQAFRMGATFVSLFIGWKEANAEDILNLISEVIAIRDNYGYTGEIIISAVRNGRQIAEAALAGADIVTAGFAVYQDAFDHPYTHVGLAKFQSFWDQTAYE